MKRTFKIGLLCFILCSSFSSISQHRFDFGIKMSTFAQERFHLEQRFHLASPFTLVGTYAFGSESSNFNNSDVNYFDSTLSTYSSRHRAQTHLLKLGVQREINWLASDVFYAGGNIGFGLRQQRSYNENSVFSLEDSAAFYPPHFQGIHEEISTSISSTSSDVVLAQLGVSFGMDVPLTERLLINVELALLYNFGGYVGHKSFYSEMVPALSGGLRYQFGKRE